MSIDFLNKTDYLIKKQNNQECINKRKCDENECCGPCWYRNVSINPNFIPECALCLEDMETFKIKVKDRKNKNIELKCKCCIYCIWFDYFDMKRKQLCKETGYTLKYDWKKENKKSNS
jgi:hypothetical protein